MKNRIRELRQAHKMTMKELGRIVGVAESTISQYETGKRQPDNETLLRISEYFDVTAGYLLGAEPQKTPAPVDDLTDEERELIAIFRRLNVRGREYLMETARLAANTYTGDNAAVKAG